MKQRHLRLLVLFIFALLLLLCLTACGEKQPEHTHKWEPANCSCGEFCFGCGETRGEALTHIWVDATCDKAKHCTLCGKTEGNVLEHTSDGNGVCAICGWMLNQVANLNVINTETEYTVYDGVMVRMYFGGLPGEGGYLSDFQIYDQNGTLVAQEEFPLSVPLLESDENGKKHIRLCLRSDFIPLPKGEYRILYRAYESCLEIYTDEDGNDLPYVPPGIETDLSFNGNRCSKRPVGELIAESVSLIVK